MQITQAETTTPPAPRERHRRSKQADAVQVRDGRRRDFFMVDNAVLDRYGAILTGNEFKVYAALARHADAERQAWPSYGGMAKRLGLDRSTVMRAIKRLEELGLVRRECQRDDAGDPTTNLYTLLDVPEVVAPMPLPSSADAATVVAPTPPGWVQPRHQGSGTGATLTKPTQQDSITKPTNNTNPAAGEGGSISALHPYDEVCGAEWRTKAGAWWSEVDPQLDATWLWGTLAKAPLIERDRLWKAFTNSRAEVERRLRIKDTTSKGFVVSPRGFAAKVLLNNIAAAAAAVPPVPAAPQSVPNQAEPVATSSDQGQSLDAQNASDVALPPVALTPQRPRSPFGREVVAVVQRLMEQDGPDSVTENQVVAALKSVIGRSVGWRRDQVNRTHKAGLIQRHWNGSTFVYETARDTPGDAQNRSNGATSAGPIPGASVTSSRSLTAIT